MSVYFVLLALFGSASLWAAPAEPEPELGNFESLTPAPGEVRTEKREVDVISKDELQPILRSLPQLVERIQVENWAASSSYVLLPHRPNYVLPLSWQRYPRSDELRKALTGLAGSANNEQDVPEMDHAEVVFQFSLKYLLAEGWLGKLSRLEVAYTNRSFWQAYNSQLSSPFRETNHEPELIFSWLTRNKWIDHFAFSLNHQSNGQSRNLSRSWNRVIASATSVQSFGILNGKFWWRIPEDKKDDANSPDGDDNPDIEKYLGYGELAFIYPRGNRIIDITVRNNLRGHDNRGSIELGYSVPINKRTKFYLQYFNGYGDSLIDYNYKQQRLSVGFKLSDWF